MLKKILSITLLITFAFQQVSYATPTYQNLATSSEIHGPTREEALRVKVAVARLELLIMDIMATIVGGDERENNQVAAKNAVIDLCLGNINEGEARKILTGLPFSVRAARKVSKKVITGKAEAIEAWIAKAIELRVISGEGFIFGNREDIRPGVSMIPVTFQREERGVQGYAVILDLKGLDVDIWISEAMRRYNFATQALTEAHAAKQSEERGFKVSHVENPGLTVNEFKNNRLTPEGRKRAVVITPATNLGFWTTNTLAIKNGKLVKRLAPGVNQKDAEKPEEPSGTFYFMVLDGGKVSASIVNLKDGEPATDEDRKTIESIGLAVANPPLIQDGKNVSGNIKFTGEKPAIDGHEVCWNVDNVRASFIAFGCNEEGNLVCLPLTGEPGKEISAREMAESMLQLGRQSGIKIRHAWLGPGSADVNFDLTGRESLIAEAHPDSATGGIKGEGRRVGAMLCVLAKPPVEPLLSIVEQPAGEDPGSSRSRIINALSNRRMVTFATHPDDVEINKGGLCALLPAGTKSQMHWGILTTGAGRTADGTAIGVDDVDVEDDTRKVSTREDEARAGAQTLGIMPGNVSFFGFGAGDTRVDGDNLNATMGEEQCRQVVEYLKKLSADLPPTEPLVVCIQNPRADKHPAHDHSYRFLRDAVNQYMAETGRGVTLLEYGLDSDAEETNLVVPLIAREVTAKLEAVKKHRTQIRRQERKKEQQPDSLTAEEFARNLSRASDEERKRHGTEFIERYKCEVLAKPQTETERMLATADKKALRNIYGDGWDVLGSHVMEVGGFALQIARRMGIAEAEQRLLVCAALLHDCRFNPLPTEKRWSELRRNYGFAMPIEELNEDAEAFFGKYRCAPEFQSEQLMGLVGQHGDDISDIPVSELMQNIHLVVAAKLREYCQRDQEDLSLLEAGGQTLEQALEMAFWHARNGVLYLRGLIEEDSSALKQLGISRELLTQALPLIEYHTHPSEMPPDTPPNIRRLAHALTAADTVSGCNSRLRGKALYGREKETYEDTFKWLKKKLAQGDIDDEVFAAVEGLILGRDPATESLICQAREIDVLPDAERQYIAKAKAGKARKQSATVLARALPRGKEERNLLGDITIEGDDIVINYYQGQRVGKTVDRFASEIVPQSARLKELLRDGATIRIRRGLRSAAQTTAKGNVVHIPEFLANQLINGKAPMALLDKVVLRNELVHRMINQHLPRSKTLEEDLAIETLATIEELKGFIGLGQRAKREIITWIRSLKLDEKDRTRIDEFIKLASEFDSEEDLYATPGLTRIALHLTKLPNSPFKEFAELKRRRELPFLITGALRQINNQAELPDTMREKLASVIQINAPPAEFSEFASRNVGTWDAATRTITGYDTLTASAQLAIEDSLTANTLPAQELLRAREHRAARVFTNERFDFPEAQDIRSVADENIRENIGTTGIALLAGGEGVRLIGQLKRMREAEETHLPALAKEMGISKSNLVQFKEYCKRLREMPQGEFDKLTKPTAPLVGDKSPLQINLETIAAINEQYGVQIPVILLVSEATRGSVEELLEKNNNFGLRNIVFVNQDTNPVVCSQEDRFLVVNNELVRAPNGTGGAVEALAEEVTLPGGRGLNASAVDWLEEQGCVNTTIVSGDAITPKECILGLIGADKEADGVALGRDFPKDKTDEGVHRYKWGTFIEITDKVTGRKRVEIVEYGERGNHKGLAEAVENVEADEDRHVSANVGLYRFSLGLIRDNIGTLRTHLSTNRDEYSTERADGSFLKVDKVEVFLTDLLARCKRPALLRGEATDGVAIKNPAILIEEAKRHNPVKFLTPEEKRAFISVASANAARRVYSRLAGPFMLEDIKNSRGELVAPGLLTIIDLDLERQGLEKPAGQEHFLTLDETRNVLRGMRNDPNFSAEFIERKIGDFPVYDEGQARTFRRSAWRNKVYDKLIRDKKVNLTNREIEYLFNNLSENGIGRYLLMFIRGQEKRSRTLAAAARKRKGPDAKKEEAAAQEAASKYKRLWDRCRKMAASLGLEGEAKAVWKDVRTTRIDARTGLELGNPDKNPFGDLREIDFDEFHREVEGRTKSKANIWSVSGVRQIFDPTFRDLPLPQGFPWRLGIGTEPTRAAKVQACTQARLFAEMLQTWDKRGDDRFEERIPLSAMKGKTDAEKRKNLKGTKRDFSNLLDITQKGKHKIGPRKIIVFTDTRSTGPALADADIRALLAAGIEVEYGGVASVTQAAVCSKENEDVDGVIYISASHNDEGYNGIKLFLGDGRVMPEAVAYPYIAVLKEKELVDPANTRRVVREVSAVPLSDVREVYANVDRVKERAIKTEEEYRDRVITGISGKDAGAKEAIEERIKTIRENNQKLKLAVIIDPNGGSREDREYFERLGFKVYELNPRPRYDMNHELCPSTGAVLRTKGDLERIRKQAQREGYALTGSIHYDTDADRRCLQPADGMGGFHLRDDMAHICFAIDVIGYVLTEKVANPDKVVGVVCNGPTSILLEELAERFGFVLLRTQTGEANVVDGMDRLEEMTFGQAQRMSKKAESGQKGSKEVFIPASLEGKFSQDTPIKVVVAGEGSNGSDFTKALLVRDPLHTIRSMVKFMDPIEGPSLVRAYFDALGIEIDEAELAGWWDSGQDMATLIYRLIDALPASFATDFFTIGGPGMMVNPPSILGKVKDNFDILFDAHYGSKACGNLASMISDAGIPDVNAGDISYEFINYEDEAKIGKGTRKGTAPIGRKIGDGGYKVKFYVTTKDGKKHALGWIWFRDSLTEAGLTRSGASFVLPKALADLVPGLTKSVQEKLVHEAYDFLKQTLGDAVKSAVAETTKQVLAATPQTLEAGPLKEYADELREEQDGKAELARIQEDAGGYMDELMAVLEREMQSGDLCEPGALEKARFANQMNRLNDTQYNSFLAAQRGIAEQRKHGQIIQLASRYIEESAELAAKKRGDVEHKTGTPKDVNMAVARAAAVKFLSGRRQVKVDPSERTYADERNQEAEYIDAARTTLKNMFIGYEASGERRQGTIDRFGEEFLKAVEAFISRDINLVGITPRDGAPFIYFGDANNHQSLHVGKKRKVIYIGQGLYDQIKSKEGSMLAAAVAHDLGRFAGLSDEKVEEAERHIVGRSQRADEESKLDDRINEIAERYAASRLKPEEIFTSVAKWVTAEEALAQAREWAGPSKRVMISYPLDQPVSRAPGATGLPGREQAYETAVLVDRDNAQPLHDLAKGARWTLLENEESSAITLVAESLKTPDPSTNRYSTPHVLHDFIAKNGYRHATKDGLAFTIEGNANRTYISESRQFLQRFLAEIKTQGKPVLLRIPIEALIGLTSEERKSWLLALNEAENAFVEIYTMQPGKVVLGTTYTTLGLGALHEKNQKLKASGFTSNRENTVTLLVTTKETESAKFERIIDGNETLQNSVIVPIARPQRGEEPGKGDAAGLIRGSLFGFRLIDIARDQQNTALIDEAREPYQNLMMLQGSTDLRIGRQDIRNLLSADSARRAAALKKIAGSLPEETAVSMEERLEIFRQAEILARSA